MPPTTLSHLTRPLRTHPRTLLRPFSSTTTTSYASSSNQNPQHDAQLDREKINTDANEYAKSGTDDTAAANEKAAFDSNDSSPEGARKKAGEGNEVNPLDASPANQEISKGPVEKGGKEV